ncbi:response regulator [Sphingomonas oligophenolica]|uniref:histidine kinase n=1 Tax=Sphingomonas oligophenolica TaxID=301154 RepID=A0A502C6P1_9SPHN|nr:response regulator [Sphingomonas oligophenolica]TPG08462.1 response regulator [Sphingomonas oligophenolica]
MELRILLLALRGRDAQVIEQLLSRDGHVCNKCDSTASLAAELESGAGTALLTEESLGETGSQELTSWLAAQPPWSDFPFILLATKRVGRRPRSAMEILEQLGNVVVLERPINSETLASAVASALRGRRRQYDARRRLEDLKAAEGRLTQLNNTLEDRIGQRTNELSAANNQLMQEVAERERAQAALAQAQKMEAVGQLTGGIAHDFNNLLTIIMGNLELIKRRASDNKMGQLAGYAHQAADRAGKLTSQLLAFSRTQRLSLMPVNLNALILGMNDLLARTIGTRVTIEMTLDGNDPWAMADENQLELAILNLAINARDAMPDGGVLTIGSATREPADDLLIGGDYGVVTVGDSGTGISAHLLEKVFDPFFTTKAIGKGTGLGLSQVYGIAQQSGGTVRVDSVEGEGTRFEIWLPAAVSVAERKPAVVAPKLEGAVKRKLVLVIDDDEGVRRFIVESLETLGYDVLHANGGEEGLRLLDGECPQLLIVDYAMPGMSGVDVVKEVHGRAPNLPIILATGYADMGAVEEVMALKNVLRKPFRIDQLDDAVRGALLCDHAA